MGDEGGVVAELNSGKTVVDNKIPALVGFRDCKWRFKSDSPSKANVFHKMGPEDPSSWVCVAIKDKLGFSKILLLINFVNFSIVERLEDERGVGGGGDANDGFESKLLQSNKSISS